MNVVSSHLIIMLTNVSHAKNVPQSSSSTGNIAILISISALVVSIILPLYLDSRQSPRVRVRISRLVHFDPQFNSTKYYVISTINNGRSGVQINHVNVSFTKRGERGNEVFLTFLDFKLCPDLPYMLGPYSNTSFAVAQAQVNEKLDDLEGCRLYGSLNLSSGYRIVSRRGLPLGKDRKSSTHYHHLKRVRLFLFGKERSGLR